MCWCAPASGTFVSHSGGLKQNASPLPILNDELQPFSFSINVGPFTTAAGIFGSVDVELLQPVPVGDIDPSAFSLSGLTGSWSRLDAQKVQLFQGTFDIPMEVLHANFGGVDNFGITLTPANANSYFINETLDGQLVQEPATNVSLAYSSVPEPSQYLMLGLVVGFYKLRRRLFRSMM